MIEKRLLHTYILFFLNFVLVHSCIIVKKKLLLFSRSFLSTHRNKQNYIITTLYNIYTLYNFVCRITTEIIKLICVPC